MLEPKIIFDDPDFFDMLEPDPQLLPNLAMDRLQAGFPLVHFPARKFPQAGHRPPRRAAREENAVIDIDDRRGSDKQNGLAHEPAH